MAKRYNPWRNCLPALVTLIGICWLIYWLLTSEPGTSSRTDKTERLVSDSLSLVYQTGRFDDDNWREVVPEVRRLASTVEQDAYALRDENHWYKDPWAIAAIILGVLLGLNNREGDKKDKEE